jgi:hypothetical protein
MRFARTAGSDRKDTPKVKAQSLPTKVEVTADGKGLVSHCGAYLLRELADRIGLTEALCEAMAPTRERRSVHDPGLVLRDLAVSIADGGECVSDLGVMRGQADLLGRIASDSTAHRVIEAVDAEALERIRSARSQARSAAWQAGGGPGEEGPLIIDIDATLIGSHSEKESAAGNYKGGFGFHPLLAYLDSGEPLAAILRAGNAGSNTAADHTELLASALEQIPAAADPATEIVVRTDAGGATHAFLADCRAARVGYSVGYELTAAVREVLGELPEAAWQAAIDGKGEPRPGAWVSELTELVDLGSWPEGTRLICRRERPHPGAQLSFSDHEGHRFTCFLTDAEGTEIAALELRHRKRARVEDAIRCGKDCGMANLPFHGFAANQAWLELSLLAQELLGWAAGLLLDGELQAAEPKRLRQRLLHVAGRLVRSGRRTLLRLAEGWPWAEALRAAFERLGALPAPSPP